MMTNVCVRVGAKFCSAGVFFYEILASRFDLKMWDFFTNIPYYNGAFVIVREHMDRKD